MFKSGRYRDENMKIKNLINYEIIFKKLKLIFYCD